MLNRKSIYHLIDGERDYQDSLLSNRTDGSEKSVGDYITMLQHYQQRLVEAWTINAGNTAALDIMRKIAGISVRCMEEHGAPPRGTD
jgi:hypothetical protein